MDVWPLGFHKLSNHWAFSVIDLSLLIPLQTLTCCWEQWHRDKVDVCLCFLSHIHFLPGGEAFWKWCTWHWSLPFCRSLSLSEFQLEDLGLYPADRLCPTNGKWVINNIINGCQQLLSNEYPHIRGLTNTSLNETLTFTIQKGEFVQVLNVSGCHWITISTLECQQGVVNVYDSILSCSVTLRTKEQIAVIIFTQARK